APGRWGRARVASDGGRPYALCSPPPPQCVPGNTKTHFAPGCADCARTPPPLYASDYVEGEVFAYVFDFFDAGQASPAFRIYYEDAPLPPELNGVLSGLQPARKADLALLNDGNWEQVLGAERLVDRAHLGPP